MCVICISVYINGYPCNFTYVPLPSPYPSPSSLIIPAQTENARELCCCMWLKHSGLLHKPHFAQSSPARIIYNGDLKKKEKDRQMVEKE